MARLATGARHACALLPDAKARASRYILHVPPAFADAYNSDVTPPKLSEPEANHNVPALS